MRYQWDRTHAQTFHNAASPFMEEWGFRKKNDPSQWQYGLGERGSAVAYISSTGLGLSVVFNIQGKVSARVGFGRRWTNPTEFYYLSAPLMVFGELYGRTLPRFYTIEMEQQTPAILDQILFDIKDILPSIMSDLSVSYFEEVEMREHGVSYQFHRFISKEELAKWKVEDLKLDSLPND